MSLIAALAGTLKNGASLDDITANWAGIAITGPTGVASTNANVTITFSSGGTRTIEVTEAGLSGSLEYRINSGTYTACPDGTTFAVSTGDTLNFRYTDGDFNETITVTVKDLTDGGRTIDTFDVTVSGY